MNSYRINPILNPVKAFIEVPASKSYTNRAFLIASLAKGRTVIKNALLSDDTIHCYKALKQLGVKIKKRGKIFEIQGTNGFNSFELRDTSYENNTKLSRILSGRNSKPVTLDLGNAGTAVRFLACALTLLNEDTIITGNQRMQNRPISDLVESLEILGVKIEYLKKEGFPPISIHGKGFLNGGKTKIKGNKSSQFLSGLLIASPFAKKDIEIEVEGELVSKPYVNMTIQIMKDFGVFVENENYKKFFISNKQKYLGHEYEIEGDLSSATYFFGIAAATGSEITITNAKYDSLQGDIKFVDVLGRMGCSCKNAINRVFTGIAIKGPSQLSALGTLNLSDMPDSAMTVAVLCALAKGKSVLTGLANLRFKECDRLKALTTELTKLGAKVKELDDGLEIHGNPSKLHGAIIETYDDHRMAMCFAVLGTKIPGIIIKNPNCVNKTYPEFWKDLEKIH
jgi:3-phosphoshikimate 1-carboxyvinyltransferase